MIVKEADINSKDANKLIEALSLELENLTGNSGKGSFNKEEMSGKGASFAICYVNEEAVGCGAIRPLEKKCAEIKRVYTKKAHRKSGVGKALLDFLENKARTFGYDEIKLETRRINEKAVRFYQGNGYKECLPYGKYIGRSEAICMTKALNN